MNNIHKHDAENITCTFTETTVDLIVEKFEGLSHRLRNELGGKIDSENSTFVVKENQIYLKLKKLEEKEWINFPYETPIHADEETKKHEGGQAGARNHMVEML